MNALIIDDTIWKVEMDCVIMKTQTKWKRCIASSSIQEKLTIIIEEEKEIFYCTNDN